MTGQARHEHYARYDFLMDALWCPGCGRVLIPLELLERGPRNAEQAVRSRRTNRLPASIQRQSGSMSISVKP